MQIKNLDTTMFRNLRVDVLVLFSLGCTEQSRKYTKARLGGREAKRDYGIWLWKYGREREQVEALAWITKAAEAGDTDAMFSLASILSAGGEGWSPNPKAIFWFRKGAEAGDPDCMGKLAAAYRYGYLGLVKDEKQFRFWMDRAMAIDREREWVRGR